MFGVLNIHKPAGLTSHDVVARVRRVLNFKKVGHAGTLDPMATGVLPIFIGPATRLLEFIHTDKSYRCEITFGIATDTWDAKGEVVLEGDASAVTEAMVSDALGQFVGELEQRIPKYSAKKIGGKKLYEIARAGGVIETLPTKQVDITKCELVSFEDGKQPKAVIDVACSSGTFMRTLAVDLGDCFDVPAHLSGLVRTSHGKFQLEKAIPLEGWMESETPEAVLVSPLPYLALPIVGALTDSPLVTQLSRGTNLPERQLLTEAPELFQQLKNHQLKNTQMCLLADKQTGAPIAVAEWRNHALKPSKVFV